MRNRRLKDSAPAGGLSCTVVRAETEVGPDDSGCHVGTSVLSSAVIRGQLRGHLYRRDCVEGLDLPGLPFGIPRSFLEGSWLFSVTWS